MHDFSELGFHFLHFCLQLGLLLLVVGCNDLAHFLRPILLNLDGYFEQFGQRRAVVQGGILGDKEHLVGGGEIGLDDLD